MRLSEVYTQISTKFSISPKNFLMLFSELSLWRMPHSRNCRFTCIICGECPRRCSRSELYRHYAQFHFSKRLVAKFGDLLVCPMCNQVLGGRKAAAMHFGQKHSMVELYLPVKAWIPLTHKRKSSSVKDLSSSNSSSKKAREHIGSEGRNSGQLRHISRHHILCGLI